MIATVFRPTNGYLRAVFSLASQVLTIQTEEGQHPPTQMMTLDQWRLEWDTPVWIRIQFTEGIETEMLVVERQQIECRRLPNGHFSLNGDIWLLTIVSEPNTPSISISRILKD